VFSTPSVFCNERGVEFTIDRFNNLLKLISAYGNSFNVPYHVALGEMSHIDYTVVLSSPRKYYILIFDDDLCTFIIDCSNLNDIKVHQSNFKIDKSIESLSWLYFYNNNIDNLALDFENNKIIPQDVTPNWHQQRFFKSQTKSYGGHIIVFGTESHLVYLVTETDAILKKHVKLDGLRAQDSIIVNDKYYVTMSGQYSIEIINLNDNDEKYQFFYPQASQLCSLYGDKFMILLWNSQRNDQIKFAVFDISLKKITQNGTINHKKFYWFQQRAFFNKDTKELFYVKRNHDLKKLKIN
jgi:hypothetical protein